MYPLLHSAIKYLQAKGEDAELLGEVPVTSALSYFYFLLDDGTRLVELEVELRMDERRISRIVTAEVRGADEVAQLLAS